VNALPGGISSLIRRLPDLDGQAFKVARAKGAWIWDEQGKSYVDHALAMGATILGHAHPAVVAACTKALEDGPMPGFSHAREAAAAEALIGDAGTMTRATFVTTGSEAVHLACRIARKTTGRPVIAKIAGGFDGWYDELAFGWSGSNEARYQGARPNHGAMTLVRYNDVDDLQRLFAERDDIAAVLVEPMLANAGSIRSTPEFNRALMQLCRAHGAMIISDEVLMGLRLRPGPTCFDVGLSPDLVTLGKAIGSGLPVAAVLGTTEAFAAVEDGRASRAGTYHGNPLVCAAVLATMETLKASDYAAFLAQGDRLRAAIEEAFRDAGVPAASSGFGSVFSLWFGDTVPTDYAAAAKRADAELALKLHLALRRRGVVTIPGAWARLFVSFAHGSREFDQVAEAYRAVARELAPEIKTRLEDARR
jgi:glutamate-1-semialdehyde 2,1-aminomutase